MNPTVIRFFLALFGAYMIWKTATAPRRGAFLTLFGNIRPDQPRAFRTCLIAGYALAAVLLLLAAFPGVWLPALASLQGI